MEYVIISNSIKENIIVKERSANYSYTFTLALNGLIAKLENGNILLCDSSTDEVIYCIPAPYMYDAAGDESFDVQYSLTATDNGKYEFTLCADESWINSTERSFPVVIDPSLVNTGQTEDTYVTPSAPNTNYGGNHSMFLSNGEVYYKFATPNLPSGTNITSAYVKFPYYYDVTKDIYATVNLYQITSYWNEKSVTWNTRPSINSTCLDTGDIHTDGATVSTPKYKSFSVTSYIRSWYTGTTNYGFALKRVGGTANSVKFVAKEKMQIFAQLTINYTGTNLSEGVYAIRRSGVNYYWRDYQPDSLGWILQDTTSHTAPPLTTSNLENLFKISYRPNYNDYVIRSMIDNSVVVYPSIYNNAPVAGYRSESDSQLSTSYTWKIEYTGGYYYLTYTQSGTKYYVRSKDDNNASKLIFTTNSSDSGTKWSFHVYTGNVYENIQPKDFSYQLTVGDTYQYVAYMRSTRIGHNGPVKYSVKATDLSTTDVATINSTTGMLTAQKVGTFKIGVTYPGAPWLWYWTVNIEKSMEGTYFIQNKHYDKYIQIDDNDAPTYKKEGGVIEQWEFDEENYQKWTLVNVGNGYYKVISFISGYAITVPAGKEDSSDTSLILKPYTGSASQQWRITKTSAGNYKIKARSSENYTSKDLVMRVNTKGLHSENGLNIMQMPYTDDTNYVDEWLLSYDSASNSIRLPNEDAQNKDSWCWAACSKMVGENNGGKNPLNRGASVLSDLFGLNSYGGVLYYGETSSGAFTADTGQRRLVVKIKGTDGNESGTNQDKESALQLASLNSMTIGTWGSGALSTTEIKAMKTELDNGRWVIGNIFTGTTMGHSIVIRSYDNTNKQYCYWDPQTNMIGYFSESDMLNNSIYLLNSTQPYTLKWVQFCR